MSRLATIGIARDPVMKLGSTPSCCAGDYVQALLLAPLVRLLPQVAPEVDLDIVTFPNLPELLDSGNLDLAISTWQSP